MDWKKIKAKLGLPTKRKLAADKKTKPSGISKLERRMLRRKHKTEKFRALVPRKAAQ